MNTSQSLTLLALPPPRWTLTDEIKAGMARWHRFTMDEIIAIDDACRTAAHYTLLHSPRDFGGTLWGEYREASDMFKSYVYIMLLNQHRMKRLTSRRRVEAKKNAWRNIELFRHEVLYPVLYSTKRRAA